MSSTTIKVSKATRDRLRQLRPDGTLDDAVNDLCDVVEDTEFWDAMADWKHRRDALPAERRRGLDTALSELDDAMLGASRG